MNFLRAVVNDMNIEISINVNGKYFKNLVKANITLQEFIRENLGLTGTKNGCGTGDCGVCTIILNGRAVNSCLVLAVEADKKDVWTVEGLQLNGELSPLQKAFSDHGAYQCGFCTPGMLMSAKALIDKNDQPSDNDIKQAVAGNICRCTGYTKIVTAIKSLTKE
jgi:aerobic carbon-monoxide dehydrogenase small subunit